MGEEAVFWLMSPSTLGIVPWEGGRGGPPLSTSHLWDLSQPSFLVTSQVVLHIYQAVTKAVPTAEAHPFCHMLMASSAFTILGSLAVCVFTPFGVRMVLMNTIHLWAPVISLFLLI